MSATPLPVSTKVSSPALTDAESLEEEMQLQQDAKFAKRSCCNLWIPCFGSDHRPKSSPANWWESITTLPLSTAEKDLKEESRHRQWWYRSVKALKKVREWSELIAGPKWKTFIRRFNKSNNHRFNSNNGKQGKLFQYDPTSYSLNFDETAAAQYEEDDDRCFRDFSLRYAAIPISARSSMDLGKDGPPSAT